MEETGMASASNVDGTWQRSISLCSESPYGRQRDHRPVWPLPWSGIFAGLGSENQWAGRRAAKSSETECQNSVTARTSRSLAVMRSATYTYIVLNNWTLRVAIRIAERESVLTLDGVAQREAAVRSTTDDEKAKL